MGGKSTRNGEHSAELDAARARIAELEESEAELARLREALRTSETQYRMAFEHTGTAMLIVEEDTTISRSNRRATHVTGFTQAEIDNVKKWTDLVVPEELDLLMGYHRQRRVDPDGIPTEYEVRAVHKSGEVRDVILNVNLIPGTSKSLVSLLDITKRTRAERELRRSEARFRETVELLPGIICEVDRSGRLVYTNRQALETFGYSQEEYDEGVYVLDLIDDEDKERAAAGFGRLLEGNFGQAVPYQLRKQDGTRVDVIITSARIEREGAVRGVRACILDVTELRRAEKLLRATQEQFRSIFLQSPVGIALALADGSVTETNRAFELIFESANAGDAINVLAVTGLAPERWSALPAGESIEHQGWWPSAGEGAKFLVWNITRMPAAEGSSAVLLAQVHDVTERRRAEEAALRAARAETAEARHLVEDLRRQIEEAATFRDMVSRSPEMKRIFGILPEVAETTATVLVQGESGTGKELIAKSLHDLSPRQAEPFVAINCSALPDTLLESELFGYEPGAFTDAKRAKPGKFALAEGGTIFLDEIGDISPAMQAKLLRVLQEREYEPLGATGAVSADVRVIAATNRDLKAAVDAGEFRQDLYYRVHVLSITLPALRDRRCDIPLLCDHFLRRYNARYGRAIAAVSSEALSRLMAYDFPGNIRELENAIEHAFIFCKDEEIEVQHLPVEITAADRPESSAEILARVKSFEDLERLYIESVLAETGGNKLHAARRLGIHKTTFFRKLKRLGMVVPGRRGRPPKNEG